MQNMKENVVIFSILQVAEAMQKMHDRKNIGKLVLDPTLEPKPKPTVSIYMYLFI